MLCRPCALGMVTGVRYLNIGLAAGQPYGCVPNGTQLVRLCGAAILAASRHRPTHRPARLLPNPWPADNKRPSGRTCCMGIPSVVYSGIATNREKPHRGAGCMGPVKALREYYDRIYFNQQQPNDMPAIGWRGVAIDLDRPRLSYQYAPAQPPIKGTNTMTEKLRARAPTMSLVVHMLGDPFVIIYIFQC